MKKETDKPNEIMGWKNRKLPHSGVTARKSRDIEILYDAEVKDITFWEKLHLGIMCHTHQKERSYLLIREDGIDSNLAVQPCCSGCCACMQKQVKYGNGYGTDCFGHMAFDSYYFNNAYKIGTCGSLTMSCGACSGGQTSRIDVIDSTWMVCGSKCCVDKSIGIVPFEDVGFPFCCMKNRINKCMNCFNLFGKVEGSPICFKPFGLLQPADPVEFVEVLKKHLPHIYNNLGESSKPQLDKEIPWLNRKNPHHGDIARKGKNIKVLYDAEINDEEFIDKIKSFGLCCYVFDVNRSYVYIREDGIEWNNSYQPFCGWRYDKYCGDENSNGCADEQRLVMHWDNYHLNSSMKPSEFPLPRFIEELAEMVPYGQLCLLPCKLICSTDIPKVELMDNTSYFCGTKCKPYLCFCCPGEGEKSIVFMPFEMCPFPCCCIRNRHNKFCNFSELCGSSTDSPIVYEGFEGKFEMPGIADPEEFVSVMETLFPNIYKNTAKSIIIDQKGTSKDQPFNQASESRSAKKETSNVQPFNQASESRSAVPTQKVELVSVSAVANVQKPVYKKIVAKDDYEKIYAHIIDANNAVDHARVLQYLSKISCQSAQDLEYFDEDNFDKLVELMKPGVPKKKLTKLIQS